MLHNFTFQCPSPAAYKGKVLIDGQQAQGVTRLSMDVRPTQLVRIDLELVGETTLIDVYSHVFVKYGDIVYELANIRKEEALQVAPTLEEMIQDAKLPVDF